MNIIICLDEKNGYCFASRRQSKDRVQLAKMLELVGDNKLCLTGYSAKLFEKAPKNAIVCEDPLKSAAKGDYCFIENIDLDNVLAEKIVIYRWNRRYPSDKKLPQSFLQGKRLISVMDFAGNSHEKITQEVYE